MLFMQAGAYQLDIISRMVIILSNQCTCTERGTIVYAYATCYDVRKQNSLAVKRCKAHQKQHCKWP